MICRFLSLASLTRSLAAVLAGIVLLGAPQSARAGFLNLYLQEDGGPIILVASSPGPVVSFTGDFSIGGASVFGSGGDFSVAAFGGFKNNAAVKSSLLESTTSVVNNTGSTHTLHLWVSANDYTLPVGSPLVVESSLGGSVDQGTLTLTNIFQAYADKNNNLLPFGTSITDFTNGSQSATMNGTSFDTGSAAGLFTRTGDYSLTSVTNFELSGGSTANFSSHVNVTAVVPEPATVVLALIALPVVGAYSWRRRKTLVACAQAA